MENFPRLNLSMMVLLFVFSTTVSATAEIQPLGPSPEYYPGTSVVIRAGDVLYSSK